MVKTFAILSMVVLLGLSPTVEVYCAGPLSGIDGSTDLDQRRRKGKTRYMTHIVNVGETPYTILTRYSISLSTLKSDNPLLNFDKPLVLGSQININTAKIGSATVDDIKAELAIVSATTGGTLASVATATSNLPVLPKDQTSLAAAAVADSNQTSYAIDSRGFIHHLVLSGQTLFSLGQHYGVSVPDIRNANTTVLAQGLKAGSVILIPATEEMKARSGVGGGMVASADSMLQDGFAPSVGVLGPTADYSAFAVGDGTRRARRFDSSYSPINISLLLPISGADNSKFRQFTEFYQGVLVALDSIKREGVSVNLNLYNTGKNIDTLRNLLYSNVLGGSDLIIGPIYNELFCEAAAYAEKARIPIVSPLDQVGCSNPFVFQMAPVESHRFDKIAAELVGKKVIFLSSTSDDSLFFDVVKRVAPQDYITHVFNAKEKPEQIVSLMDSKRETVFVVAANDEHITDAMLSKLSSAKTYAFGKSMSVLGSPKFARMKSLDPAYFFRLNVSYVTSYHVDRSNSLVRAFDANYISTFGKVPSLYAYRGYDIAMFFLGSMVEFGSEFYNFIDDYYTTILQVRYRTTKAADGGGFYNPEWVLVNYTPSYDILVK